MKYFSIVSLLIVKSALSECNDFSFTMKKTTSINLNKEIAGETSLDPNNVIWISDQDSNLHRGNENINVKTNGDIVSSILFFGQGSSAAGLVGTTEGWAYLLRTDGKIAWKKELAKGDSFPYPAIKTSNGFSLVSRKNRVFDFSPSGAFIGERPPSSSTDGELIAAPNAFEDGTIICSVDATDASGKTAYKTRLIKPNGQIIEYRTPEAVKHIAGISTDGNTSVLYGIKGLLRFVNKNGNEIGSRKLNCAQVGGFTKLAKESDTFVASCYDSLTKKVSLITINPNGRVSDPIFLPSSPSSDFSVFINPITLRPNIAAGFEDGIIRTIDPMTGAITSEWDDKTGVATITRPIPTDSGLIVQRDLEVVTLEWQTGSSSKQPIKTSSKDCGPKKSTPATPSKNTHFESDQS